MSLKQIGFNKENRGGGRIKINIVDWDYILQYF